MRPASRSIGMMVPSAVPVRAIAMIAAAAGSDPSAKPAASASTADTPHQPSARRAGVPRSDAGSISLPAMKNSAAIPKFDSASSIGPSLTQPSPEGPISMPRPISNTTSGITTARRTRAASSGATTATSGTSSVASSVSFTGILSGVLALHVAGLHVTERGVCALLNEEIRIQTGVRRGIHPPGCGSPH